MLLALLLVKLLLLRLLGSVDLKEGLELFWLILLLFWSILLLDTFFDSSSISKPYYYSYACSSSPS